MVEMADTIYTPCACDIRLLLTRFSRVLCQTLNNNDATPIQIIFSLQLWRWCFTAVKWRCMQDTFVRGTFLKRRPSGLDWRGRTEDSNILASRGQTDPLVLFNHVEVRYVKIVKMCQYYWSMMWWYWCCCAEEQGNWRTEWRRLSAEGRRGDTEAVSPRRRRRRQRPTTTRRRPRRSRQWCRQVSKSLVSFTCLELRELYSPANTSSIGPNAVVAWWRQNLFQTNY